VTPTTYKDKRHLIKRFPSYPCLSSHPCLPWMSSPFKKLHGGLLSLFVCPPHEHESPAANDEKFKSSYLLLFSCLWRLIRSIRQNSTSSLPIAGKSVPNPNRIRSRATRLLPGSQHPLSVVLNKGTLRSAIHRDRDYED
jgi:hypothetical protein